MLKKLKLFDFRNHQKREFEFSDWNVVFVGANGRGKTNILEAISVLSVGKSWRETSPRDLIFDDRGQSSETELEPSAMIEALFRDNFYKVLIRPRLRQFEKNEKKILLKNHFGKIPTLLFAPEHLGLFSGSKRDRQKFFDRFLAQIFPGYRENLSRAIKASRQKNAIFRNEALDSSSSETLTQIGRAHV